MAFAFFRRRQKLVIIIMVVLMVSFLIGFQGFSELFGPGAGDGKIVETPYGDLTSDTVNEAEASLRILGAINMPMEHPELAILMEHPRAAERFALLLLEAEGHDLRVGDVDVQRALEDAGIKDEQVQAIIRGLRQQFRGLTVEDVRAAVADWLKVRRMLVRSAVDAPPSEAELRTFARDRLERVALGVVKIPAEAFLDEVVLPNEERIQQQFAQYRRRSAGPPTDPMSFGFGYEIPERAQVLYLFLRARPIESVITPPQELLESYYTENIRQFTGPDGQPLPFSQAEPQIVRTLRPQLVGDQLQRIEKRIRDLFQEYKNTPAAMAEGHEYQWALRQMVVPDERVQEVLGRTVRLRTGQVPVARAVAAVAKAGGLNSIYYPTRNAAGDTLDPNVEVSLQGEMTVGEALAQISRQAQWTEFTWGMIQAMPEVLFPREDPHFPLVMEETETLTPQQFVEHPLLPNAVGANGMALREYVYSPAVFNRGGPRTAPLKVGQDGPTMLVRATPERTGGLLLWRLRSHQPAREPSPEDLTGELRDRVVRDLKLEAAFARALDAARAIDTVEEFEQARQNPAYRYVETDLFSRAQIQAGQDPNSLNLPRLPQVFQEFLQTVFSPVLLPEDPDAGYGEKSQSLVVMPLRAKQPPEVLVMRRVGYEPLDKSQYEGPVRQILLGQAMQASRQLSIRVWYDGVYQRLGVERERIEGTQQIQQ